MDCALEETTGTMSSDQPVFAFGNQPETQANGAAQQDDEFSNAALETPAPELMEEQQTQNAAAAQPPAAATPQPRQPAASSQQPLPRLDLETTLSAEAENRIVERLLSTLQTLGIAQQRPMTPTVSASQPEAQPEEAEQDPWTDWTQDPWNQNGGNWNSWNQGRWDQSSWKPDNTEDRDRPYLSHLDFPTFNGNKEDFANYKYIVANLKAQCG